MHDGSSHDFDLLKAILNSNSGQTSAPLAIDPSASIRRLNDLPDPRLGRHWALSKLLGRETHDYAHQTARQHYLKVVVLAGRVRHGRDRKGQCGSHEQSKKDSERQ